LYPLMAGVRPRCARSHIRGHSRPQFPRIPPMGGIYEQYTNLGGLGPPPVDVRTPELLREIAGSRSGFVLRNASGLLAHACASRRELHGDHIVGLAAIFSFPHKPCVSTAFPKRCSQKIGWTDTYDSQLTSVKEVGEKQTFTFTSGLNIHHSSASSSKGPDTLITGQQQTTFSSEFAFRPPLGAARPIAPAGLYTLGS